jgi:hypothetical protein
MITARGDGDNYDSRFRLAAVVSAAAVRVPQGDEQQAAQAGSLARSCLADAKQQVCGSKASRF